MGDKAPYKSLILIYVFSLDLSRLTWVDWLVVMLEILFGMCFFVLFDHWPKIGCLRHRPQVESSDLHPPRTSNGWVDDVCFVDKRNRQRETIKKVRAACRKAGQLIQKEARR